ncbi:hypothetical protein BJ165DRAFT_1132832 [Panaeolus papilionaceus]|nr:hypothetical protein BJ165DRAFT_1132832 [Panaeolus papilionaceus]
MGGHFLSAWRRYIDQLFIPEHHTMLHYFNDLLLQVDKLTNIQAITFHFNPAPDYNSSPPVLRHPYLKYKMQIFHTLSTAQLSDITYLSLQTNLNVLLPHWRNDIVFPNLATLKVRVETNHMNDTSAITKLFIPLVNNHHRSLIELVLSHSPYVDLKHILNGINHLPSLQTLSLCWFTINSISQKQAISKFIARHKARLVDLRLRILPITVFVVRSERLPTDDAKSVWNGLFDHNFPSLQYLSLLFKVPLDLRDTNTICDFLFRHKTLHSLTTLPVETSNHLANLSVDVMTHFRSDNKLGFSFSQLQRLFIHSATLDIDLMAFFASSFPSLRYLCICGLTELLNDTVSLASSYQSTYIYVTYHIGPYSTLNRPSRATCLMATSRHGSREQFRCLFRHPEAQGDQSVCGGIPFLWAFAPVMAIG